MKRLLKSWVFWVFIALPLGATAAYFTYQRRDNYECVCASRQVRSQWHFGFSGTSVPLSAISETTRTSRFLLDFPDPVHAHVWGFRQGSPYYLLGTSWGGCGVGGREVRNDLLRSYEAVPKFADSLQARIQRGELTPAEVLAALRAPETTAAGNAWMAEWKVD
ncbi:MAG TPA: hypothetical protein VF950_00875 [Planctomycetota bacterium]